MSRIRDLRGCQCVSGRPWQLSLTLVHTTVLPHLLPRLSDLAKQVPSLRQTQGLQKRWLQGAACRWILTCSSS